MSSVFLSHTSADKPFVRRLADDLRDAGVRVWLDEAEIQVGDSLLRKIEDGISSMEYLAVVLSPRSVSSEWVQRELEAAMNEEIGGKKVKVLPLLMEKCDLPPFLRGKLYADFTTETEYANSLSQLITRIQGQTENHRQTFVKPKHAVVSFKDGQQREKFSQSFLRVTKEYRIHDVPFSWLLRALKNMRAPSAEVPQPLSAYGEIRVKYTPVTMTISNAGAHVLEDWHIEVHVESGECKLVKQPIGPGRGYRGVHFTDDCPGVYEEGNTVFFDPGGRPLVQHASAVFKFYASAPPKEAVVVLRWRIIARDYSNDDNLKLDVVPNFTDIKTWEYVSADSKKEDDIALERIKN